MSRYRGWDAPNLKQQLAASVKLVKKQTEKSFQADVTKLAAMYGWKFYHTWNSFHSVAGFPDLVLARPPRLIFAELKSDLGKLSAEQISWSGILAGCPGVESYVWRPKHIEDVVRILKSEGPKTAISDPSNINVNRPK
jgi:hypothetical protein